MVSQSTDHQLAPRLARKSSLVSKRKKLPVFEERSRGAATLFKKLYLAEMFPALKDVLGT